MGRLEKRLEKLEKNPKVNEPERDIWLVIVTGKVPLEESQAKAEAAIAEYRAAHPEDVKRKIHAMTCENEHAKELVERLFAG